MTPWWRPPRPDTAGCRFRRQHDGVRTFEHGRGNVRHFSAGRNRRRDHAFQHLRGNDNRLAGAAAGAGQLLLQARNGFQRHFHAQVATGYHQRVGKLDDFLDALDGLWLFDLGHQADAALGDLAHFCQIFRTLHEGKRHPIHLVGCEDGIEISAVLVGQNTDGEQRIRQADALAVRDGGSGNHSADNALAVALFRLQHQLAIVDQQAMTRLYGLQDFRMRQENTGLITRRFIVVEREGLARSQGHLGICKLSDAQLGTLQVGENANGAAVPRFDRADPLDQRAHHIMAGMAHVDAEEVGACQMQFLDHRLVGGGRPQRCEDLHFAIALHQFWPSCVPGVSDNWTIQLP